jgi:hypothetical protein
VNVGMGGFHPNAIARSLINGDGFPEPRKFGLMAAALGFGILVIESILIFAVHIWFPWFYIIAFPLFWGGVWMLILGQPKAQPDGSKAPMWGRVVVGGVMVLGILQGLSFAFGGFMH